MYMCTSDIGIYEWIYLGMYLARHTQVCMSKYVSVYKCIYVCMCAYICTRSTPMSVYTYLMSLNKYCCQITNMGHRSIMLNRPIGPTFLHMYAKTQPPGIFTSRYCYIWASNKHASQMSHICHIHELLHVHMRELFQQIYLIWTHCNQQSGKMY